MRRSTTEFQLIAIMALLAAIITEGNLAAEQYDGYTEPADVVNVAVAEAGIVDAVVVREGDAVQEGQVLAQLDDELHLKLLAIAEEAMRAEGQLNSALAELQLHRHRLEKLTTAREQGYARQEEVFRAAADVGIAEAKVLTVREDLGIKELEAQRIRIQVARLTVRAPMDGVITKIHKKKGEYVGPNDPHLLEMVKLTPLLAKFSIPSNRARKLSHGETVTIHLDPSGAAASATVSFIGPVTDAQSGTVQVKAEIENDEGKFYSGERCTIQLAGEELAQRTD